jgi:hypothetical protein
MSRKPTPRIIKDVKKNRQTGTHIQVDFGLNEANYYQATCYTHGKYCSSHRYDSIMIAAADPLGWCTGCQDEYPL